MDSLNSMLLDQLVPSMLEITNVDIKRLRDDRSEIQLGDEVAFVATATFRLTADGVGALKRNVPAVATRELAAGSRLFSIGADAELSSELLTVDEDSAARWLADHYDFAFLLDGAPHGPFRPVGQIRVPPDDQPSSSFTREVAVPWIQKLNTAAIKGDYVDVDVQISPKPSGTTIPPFQTLAWQQQLEPVASGQHLLATLVADVPAHAAAHLAGKRFRIPVEDEGGEVRFSLTFAAAPEASPPAPPAGADTPQPGSDLAPASAKHIGRKH
jgi:hypothetical protein